MAMERQERERRGLEPGPRQCRARSKSQHRPNPPEPPKPRRAQPAQGTPAQPEQGCFQSNEEKPKPEQGPSQSTGTKEETVPECKKPKPNAENASKPAEAEQAVEPEPE